MGLIKLIVQGGYVLPLTVLVADIFSFMGHGRDESLWLKNSMICGGGIQSTKTGNLPNCRITGKCFIENTEIVPIHNIPALSVFVNACLTGKMYCSIPMGHQPTEI